MRNPAAILAALLLPAASALAQAGRAPSAARDPTRVFIVVGLLIATVLVLGLLILAFRKKLLAGERDDRSAPLLLDDLRAMRRRGDISDSEYELMRSRLVQKLSGRSAEELSARAESTARPMHSGRAAAPPKPAQRTPDTDDPSHPAPESGKSPPDRGDRPAKP